MERFQVQRFTKIFHAFGRLRELARVAGDRQQSEEEVIVLGVLLSEMALMLKEVGLPYSEKLVQHIQHQAEQGPLSGSDLSNFIDEFLRRVYDETELIVYLSLEPSKSIFFGKLELFGESVAQVFPSSGFDIEEAGNCLALSRGTACVFHLMRVLEIGLYTIADALGVQKIEVNWHNAIEQIEKEIRGLPTQTAQEKSDLAFYSEASAFLFGVKEPWRNRSAHAGHTYTEEKAGQIFESVRGFMQVLSTKLTKKPS